MGYYKNPLHLDVVDRYLRRMGDKNDFRRGSAESGIVLSPIRHGNRSTTIKTLWIICLVHRSTAYFNLKRALYQCVADRLMQIRKGCVVVYTCPFGDAKTVILVQDNLYPTPTRLHSHPINIKNKKHNCTCVDGPHLGVVNSLLHVSKYARKSRLNTGDKQVT